MQRSLGEKIGEGAYADVHAWAPGQVIKLFKPNIPVPLSWHEAQMTRIAFAAGAPAPQVFGEVTVAGRFGMVLQRLDGPTPLQLSRTGAMTFEQAGAILATLVLAVHETFPPPDMPSLRCSMEAGLRHVGNRLPRHIATGILAWIERLAPADELCHGDLHPGNVIVTEEGPKLIDWMALVRAPAALDLASTHFLLAEIAPRVADDPERPRATDAALQSEYARLAGLSQAALRSAIDSYLPVAYVRALFCEAMHAHQERLIRRIEAALRLQD